jgi:hypothetical protein
MRSLDGRISIDRDPTGQLGQERLRLDDFGALLRERSQRLTSYKVRVRVVETVSLEADLTVGMGNMLKVLKYATVLAVVAGLIVNLPDIKRYIKISTM